MKKVDKNAIFNYMLKLIGTKDKELVSKTIEAFNISKSTVYNYISELSENGYIEKTDGNKSAYKLKTNIKTFTYKKEKNSFTLEESRIYNSDIEPLLCDLEENVKRCWRYAFTEMMNNAIEHSRATKIDCLVFRNALETSILICDNGIGIFNNIREFIRQQKNEDLTLNECASLLFAGKFTTAKDFHSGEGIFFTSHLCDSFIIISDDTLFTRTSFNSEMLNELKESYEGTVVYMNLSNHTNKTPAKIFDLFSDPNDGFYKTHIPISHVFSSAYPVSRSEARRLGEMICKFKEVTLDFSGVEEVGQAFTHELFSVWQRQNPDVELNVKNANTCVMQMINRIKNNK